MDRSASSAVASDGTPDSANGRRMADDRPTKRRRDRTEARIPMRDARRVRATLTRLVTPDDVGAFGRGPTSGDANARWLAEPIRRAPASSRASHPRRAEARSGARENRRASLRARRRARSRLHSSPHARRPVP